MEKGNLDTIDKLVVFLAKRDGIDKLVKTLQYIGKLGHYSVERRSPILTAQYKNLEVAAGLSRKAFRTGRSLTGFNALRHGRYPDLTIQLLTIFGFGGEIVYWLFDHFTWLSKVGVLDAEVATGAAYISAFGESVGYIFFITADGMQPPPFQQQASSELSAALPLTTFEIRNDSTAQK